MKLTFLGTGTSQGVPVIACECEVCKSTDPRDNRLRTSALLEIGDTTLVFDTGPDFRQQMLRANVRDLDAVLYTHQHKDHVAGLDDVRAFNFILDKVVDIYCNQLTLDHLKQEFYYIFETGGYPGAPRINVTLIDEEPFKVNGIEVIPIPVMHHNLPVLGFRIGDFAYITDANFISPASMEKLQGVKVLVLNALRLKAHRSHFTLEEAVEIVDQIQPEQTYFTHISHLMGLHETVTASLPENIAIAWDGMEVNL